jgi:hypothetical protein
MAKSYQVTIDGIVWCGAYHLTKFGSLEFQGFPHPDYDSEELAELLGNLRGENK